MKKRTKLEVIKNLLEVLKQNKKVKITHLIYKANLSNNSIKPHIESLLKNQFILQEENEGKKMYYITSKGQEFLDEFKKMKIFEDSYGLG